MSLKPFDVVIIFIIIGIITLYFIDTVSVNNDNSFLKVEVEGKEYIYSLEKDKVENFTGTIGETTIKIENGKASFVDSPCNNKTCIKIGEIDHVGETSACLPNRVLITIEGDKENDIDVISY